MRVALCSDWFYPRIGGVASHMKGLAEELVKRGHYVQIITRTCPKPKQYLDISLDDRVGLCRIKPILPIDIVAIPPTPGAVKAALSKGSFDVVHCHHAFTPISLMSISTAKNLGMTAVLTNHTISILYRSDLLWTPTSYLAFLLRRCIEKADTVVAVSKAAAEFISHFTGWRKITVIPNAVDTERFGRLNACKSHEPSILYLGRLVHRKGVHVLVKSMPHVLKEVPDAKLTIAGDGYMKTYLRFQARKLGVKRSVRFLSSIADEDVPRLYGESDVFVLPSLYGESFGISLLEAMASSKPIVASKVGGIPEVVQNRVTGLLVKSGSVRELAEAIVQLLSDRNLSRRLGTEARRIVERKYSWKVVATRIESLYKELTR
ncbi:MAG: glycosyl transferase [Candidatus Bathyarchaeota archaeon B24]|nr:MAG: glycosyl transferase [Candidatus Bathyarchaeota archaeon B24]